MAAFHEINTVVNRSISVPSVASPPKPPHAALTGWQPGADKPFPELSRWFRTRIYHGKHSARIRPRKPTDRHGAGLKTLFGRQTAPAGPPFLFQHARYHLAPARPSGRWGAGACHFAHRPNCILRSPGLLPRQLLENVVNSAFDGLVQLLLQALFGVGFGLVDLGLNQRLDLFTFLIKFSVDQGLQIGCEAR